MAEGGLSLLHYVSLDGAGGVELQFADFIATSRALGLSTGQVVACGDGIHPLVADRLPGDTHLAYEKYAGPVKLPKWPPIWREVCQKRRVKQAAPDAVVIWNRLRDSLNTLAAAGPARCVYWERGAGWFAEHTAAKQRFLAGCCAVLCNSHAAKRMLELRWAYQGQCCVVPNALRPALAPHNEPPRHLADSDGVWRLGVAARLETIKGVALVLHAVSHLRRVGHRLRLQIAGDGPQRKTLQNLATRLGIADCVVFLGLVGDMAGFYRDIDLLLHPALREPFGQIVIEAAAYGVPSVVAGVDGLVEVVADGQTGTVLTPSDDVAQYACPAGDATALPPYVYHPNRDVIDAPKAVAPDRLAAAVVDLLGAPARYAEFSRAGKQRVAMQFDFDTHVRRANKAIARFVAPEDGRLSWDEVGP